VRRKSNIVAATLLFGACAQDVRDIGREPHMTPVGAGLQPNRIALLADSVPAPASNRGNSIWRDTSADLFRDPRAMRVGDVVTVRISIKDKASLDNTSTRERDATRTDNMTSNYSLNYPFLTGNGQGTIASNVSTVTSSKGDGAITRSESIDLLVAAVVSEVLPNGNLVISGSQEVRVNFEVRVLNVAGVLRPRDIATDNSVSYDKVAEARISYGGRGRLTEVQQPSWGQQVLDWLLPF
jgi:flagellar L-ring protein precursor FlgH